MPRYAGCRTLGSPAGTHPGLRRCSRRNSRHEGISEHSTCRSLRETRHCAHCPADRLSARNRRPTHSKQIGGKPQKKLGHRLISSDHALPKSRPQLRFFPLRSSVHRGEDVTSVTRQNFIFVTTYMRMRFRPWPCSPPTIDRVDASEPARMAVPCVARYRGGPWGRT